MLSREKELWMVALQIERIHGADGAIYIEGRRKHFEELGEEAGAALWREIARKFDALNPA